MLARLSLKLEADGEVGVFQSSNLHGVIMETIDSDYADVLHSLKYNPYSQHIEKDDYLVWVINTYTKEAYEKIIVPFLDNSFDSFEITGRDIKVNILGKELQTHSKKELLDKFYSNESDHFIDIDFMTPTSFKSNNRYLIFPEIELIYKNLMKKYSSSGDIDMFDDETLEELVKASYISQYNLRSCFFPLEKVKIQGFKGHITIKVVGNQTITNYARLLFEFGEYSGVGIKCSMGMGAIQIRERKQR